MAWQLIYTSAPRGLVPGRSGFCTVARHREIRDGLVTAIERFSQYDRSGRGIGAQSPVVYAHRIVRLGGSNYHVLSCTRDAGADYTGRTNHLAHHLICEPHELAGAPSPAEVLRQMAWQRTWTDAPRYLTGEDAIVLRRFHPTATLPAQTWQSVTGDAGCAALPLESGALAGCYWLYPSGAGEQELLPLFAESLLLLDPSGRSSEKLWQVPFTTYLQTTDHTADFFWRGCWHGSPAAITAQGARQTIDFTQPRNLRPPTSEAAELARTGYSAAGPANESAPMVVETPVETGLMEYPIESRGHDLELAALLKSADSEGTKKRVTAKTVTPAMMGNGEGGKGAGTRKPIIRLIIATVVTAIVLGVMALGLGVWRDGKAEEIVGELKKARTSGDFTFGPKRVATISGIFRGYEPLKNEIECTLVAAELDGLKGKTPSEAQAYLIKNRDRLDGLAIQHDGLSLERIEKIKRWCDVEGKLNTLKGRITAETFRDRTADEVIKKSFADSGAEIAKLDAPYRPTITNLLDETKRLYVTRRLETLEQANKDGKPPDKLESLVRDLGNDAKNWAPELKSRIANLNQPQPSPPATPKPAPPEKQAVPDPAVANNDKAKAPLGLPEMTTYIATDSDAGFDVSAVKELQGDGIPGDDKTWHLFRAPGSTLAPEITTQEECLIVGKKLYVTKTNVELLTLQSQQLRMSPAAKTAFPENFLLRFTRTKVGENGFQILFQHRDKKSFALLQLPIRDSLTSDPKRATIKFHPELASALRRIKLAGSGDLSLQFLVRLGGRYWPEYPLPISLDEAHPEVVFDLTATIKKIGEEIEAGNLSEQESKKKSREEKKMRMKKARDLLMGRGDKTGLSQAGWELFGNSPDIKIAEQLYTTVRYANQKPLEGELKDLEDLKDGLAYLVYTKELFNLIANHWGDELKKIKEKLAKKDTERLKLIKDHEKFEIDKNSLINEDTKAKFKVDVENRNLKRDKQKQHTENPALVKGRQAAISYDSDVRNLEGQIKSLELERGTIIQKKTESDPILAPIAKRFADELSAKSPDCANVIKIWTDIASHKGFTSGPLQTFHQNWARLFTKSNIELIRPFLEWNPEETVAGAGTLPGKQQVDFTRLIPFSIEQKTRDRNPIRLIDFIEVSSAAAAKAVEESK